MVFGVVCGVGRGSLGCWEGTGGVFGGFIGWVGVLGEAFGKGLDGWMGGGSLSLTYFSMQPIISCLYLTFISSISLVWFLQSLLVVPLAPVYW